MNKLTLNIEKVDGSFNAWIDDKSFFFSTDASTVEGAKANLCDQIRDYQIHEGVNDARWKNVDVDKLKFEVKYDLTALFEMFPINVSALSDNVGFNRSLISQYKNGTKKPGPEQVVKIQAAIRSLGEQLSKIQLV